MYTQVSVTGIRLCKYIYTNVHTGIRKCTHRYPYMYICTLYVSTYIQMYTQVSASIYT